MDKPVRHETDVVQALIEEYPELRPIAVAAGETPIYVVGGAVRDLFAGRGRTDLDIAVEGDPLALAKKLDPEALVSHDRFQTASLNVDSLPVDLSRTRRETYAHPGALPEVEPASIEEDLARRDFTVNAMAVSIGSFDDPGSWRLLDPYGGAADLAAGVLRLLHADSIRDDPTRALRGARYAAAYELFPDPDTAAQLASTDLESVSWQRRRADLLRIAESETAASAFALLQEWGVAKLRSEWRRRLAEVKQLLASQPWAGTVDPKEAAVAAVWPEAANLIGHWRPEPQARPSEMVAAAKGRTPLQLLLARADGAVWLDEYMVRLRHIGLEIGGADLVAAGLEPGPAIGRGLKVALERKLNGEISGRAAELQVALAAAKATCHD